MKKTMNKIMLLVLSAYIMISASTLNIKAETVVNVPMTVKAESLGSDINESQEMYYNYYRNDDSYPYRLSYSAQLEMASICQNYRTVRSFAIFNDQFSNGMTKAQAVAKWQSRRMRGSWNIEFEINQDVQEIRSNFLTKEGFQARLLELNDNELIKYFKVTNLVVDENSNKISVTFELYHNDSEGVKILDSETDNDINNLASSLIFSTPTEGIVITQSNFVPGTTVGVKNISVNGSITLEALFIPQLPIVYSSTLYDINVDLKEAQSESVVVSYEDTLGKTLFPNKVLTGRTTQPFSTSAEMIEGYTLVSTADMVDGHFSESAQSIVFVYEKDTTVIPYGTIHVNFLNEDHEMIAPPRIISDIVDREFSIQPLSIEGYVFDKSDMSLVGRVKSEMQVINVYYKKSVTPEMPVDPVVPQHHQRLTICYRIQD